MNRCSVRFTSRRIAMFALAACLSGATAIAHAQFGPRLFPANAQRGTFQVVQPPDVLINDQAERLAPGARIRNINNMLVLSATIVGQRLLVNYVREPGGLIRDVWILTEAEANLPPPSSP